MNCFYHSDVQAVGLCKSCMRGLCVACAADSSRSLACKERCEEDVRQLDEMIQRNARLIDVATVNARGQRTAMIVVGIFVALFGGFFVWGSLQREEEPIWVMLVLGVLLILYALYMILRSYRFRVPR